MMVLSKNQNDSRISKISSTEASQVYEVINLLSELIRIPLYLMISPMFCLIQK